VLEAWDGITASPTPNTKALSTTWPSAAERTLVETVYTPSLRPGGSDTLSAVWSPLI
jgi:hypothetical protein